MSSQLLDQSKARDIGFAITNENHVRKGDRPLRRRNVIVDPGVIVDVLHSFVDPEQILSLSRIVQRERRPRRNPMMVVYERRSVYIIKIFRNRASQYHFTNAGGYYVMR